MSYDKALWVIVEGKVTDPYFADKLCSSSARIAINGYEVRLISQIKMDSGAYAGGKQALLSLFEQCKNENKLVQYNKKGARAVAFLIDRDTQHITGGRKRSAHVVYTAHADSEAHVLADAHAVDALAAAASLEMATARDLVRDLRDWRTELADDWRQWIELCYIAVATRASTARVGFGHPASLVHKGRAGRILDAAKYQSARYEVEATSPMSTSDFAMTEAKIKSAIDQVYESGDQATLLKGKWLPRQLTLLVSAYFRGAKWNSSAWHEQHFQGSVTRCYAAHLDVRGSGFRKVQAKLERLV